MTYRKPLIALAVLGVLAAGSAFAVDTPADPAKPRPTLDKNGDGFVDRSEAAASPRLAEKFDELDKNKDGKLSRDELPRRHGWKGRHDGGPMAKLDADKDGRISREEAKADPKFAERFDKMDANKDGFVDKADFQLRAKQHRDEWFAAADTDKDGKLSKAEFDAASGKHGRFGHDGKRAHPPKAEAAK
ncbi:MAG TPA: hypothetical protein DDZ67_01745 [Xanthomonadaceae bacterium]|nr:hypothetical protein [Xanthomonadaceae bacterium]